jgi:hypothetical protein
MDEDNTVEEVCSICSDISGSDVMRFRDTNSTISRCKLLSENYFAP